MKCAEVFNQYKKNDYRSVNIENNAFSIHNLKNKVNRMHFNVLYGIEPKLLIAYLGSIEILNLQNLDYAVKIIPAFLVSAFTIYKWVIFYRKNKKNENNN